MIASRVSAESSDSQGEIERCFFLLALTDLLSSSGGGDVLTEVRRRAGEVRDEIVGEVGEGERLRLAADLARSSEGAGSPSLRDDRGRMGLIAS